MHLTSINTKIRFITQNLKKFDTDESIYFNTLIKPLPKQRTTQAI